MFRVQAKQNEQPFLNIFCIALLQCSIVVLQDCGGNCNDDSEGDNNIDDDERTKELHWCSVAL